MEKGSTNNDVRNKVIKGVIPIGILAIVVGSGYVFNNIMTKNTETYYSVSSDAAGYGDGEILLRGSKKVSGKSVAKKIEEADLKSEKENVYAFRIMSEDLNVFEPIYVSVSGEPAYVTMIDQNGFDGFGYGKVMYNKGWHDPAEFEKTKVLVDPISTEELSKNYYFYSDEEQIIDDVTNSHSSHRIYVMERKNKS